MTQYDQYQSAPPPGYPAEQPAYGQPGYQPQKTNTMAILGLVFAFVFSPLGIVFSAIGLKQIKQRRESGRGLALAGLILSIIFVVLGMLVVVLAATVFSSAVQKAQAESAGSVAPHAATDAGAAGDDPTGVVTACGVIVPAVLDSQTALATVETPEDYTTIMTDLMTTMESAAGQTTDATFVTHVKTLSGDFQQAVDAVNAGEDPSALEAALTTDGTQIDNDCAAAGYVQ